MALSDRPAADLSPSRSYGFHHAGVALGFPFEHELSSGPVLVMGPFVSWDWAAEAVRSTGLFSWGARITLEH